MAIPASISTALFTVSILSNSITGSMSILFSLRMASTALRVGMSGSKLMNLKFARASTSTADFCAKS